MPYTKDPSKVQIARNAALPSRFAVPRLAQRTEHCRTALFSIKRLFDEKHDNSFAKANGDFMFTAFYSFGDQTRNNHWVQLIVDCLCNRMRYFISNVRVLSLWTDRWGGNSHLPCPLHNVNVASIHATNLIHTKFEIRCIVCRRWIVTSNNFDNSSMFWQGLMKAIFLLVVR